MPDALESGRVQIQSLSLLFLLTLSRVWAQDSSFVFSKGHNFFDPQPAWHDDDSEGLCLPRLQYVPQLGRRVFSHHA
jgi:hypothetical protein